MLLMGRRGLQAFLVLAALRLGAFGCAGPEAFQSNLVEDGGAGTTAGVGGNAAGGAGGDITPSGLAGTAGFDAGVSGTAGLGDAGGSGVAGATGGSAGSVAGQGGNISPDGGAAGMPPDSGMATGGAGAQGGAGGSAGQAGAGGAAGSGTAGTGGGGGVAVVDHCDRTRWTPTASINAGTAPQGVDGDLTTRYTTGRPMQAGDYYQVDFTANVFLTAVTLNNTQTSGSDFAVTFDLYSSPDTITWTKFASGPGSMSSTTISFAKTSLRYVRVQVNKPSGNTGLFFSIGELQVACSN